MRGERILEILRVRGIIIPGGFFETKVLVCNIFSKPPTLEYQRNRCCVIVIETKGKLNIRNRANTTKTSAFLSTPGSLTWTASKDASKIEEERK